MLAVAVILLIVGVIGLILFYSGATPDAVVRGLSIAAVVIGFVLLLVDLLLDSGEHLDAVVTLLSIR